MVSSGRCSLTEWKPAASQVEKIFAIQGIGMLVLDSLTKRDYPTIQAFILLIGIVVFLINGLVDLSYRWLDPAIALKGRKA